MALIVDSNADYLLDSEGAYLTDSEGGTEPGGGGVATFRAIRGMLPGVMAYAMSEEEEH